MVRYYKSYNRISGGKIRKGGRLVLQSNKRFKTKTRAMKDASGIAKRWSAFNKQRGDPYRAKPIVKSFNSKKRKR